MAKASSNSGSCPPGDEFRKLLKTITANQQLDTETILKKCDECLQTMADRHLTDRQKAILVSALRPFHGNQVEFTVYFGGSPEAYHFAEDFVAVFRQSEFTFRIYNMGADKTGINRLGNLSGAPPLLEGYS